ncbi:hypothetical protein AAVH_03789 [Aphelenchoides avenae]|nr:hypothetical protein AAVH_03789 [Aphelenchus avenae]
MAINGHILVSDVIIDILRFTRRGTVEAAQLTCRLMNYAIVRAQRTLPHRQISDVYSLVASLKFLPRDEIERIQPISRAFSTTIGAFNGTLARRTIPSVTLLEDAPFHLSVLRNDHSIRHPRTARIEIYDIGSARTYFNCAYIAQFTVTSTPGAVVQQHLTAIRFDTPFVVGVLHYISLLQVPSRALLGALQCKQLKWCTVQSVRGQNANTLLQYCADNRVEVVEFERLCPHNDANNSVVLTDTGVLNFVASRFAARGAAALRLDYGGDLSENLAAKLIEKIQDGMWISSLCVDIRAPDQQLGRHSKLKQVTGANWTLRIDGLDLTICWNGDRQRLRISKNHSPGQHCSCFF